MKIVRLLGALCASSVTSVLKAFIDREAKNLTQRAQRKTHKGHREQGRNQSVPVRFVQRTNI